MRVKCLAQEHNAVPRPGLEPGPPDPESSALTIRPPRLPDSKTNSSLDLSQVKSSVEAVELYSSTDTCFSRLILPL